MIDRQHINEVIIVEGRSDTQNIARAVIADTIETGGSAVDQDVIDRAKLVAKQRGVIIFTDPDFNGQRIRNIITKAIPTAKQAYITQDQARASRDNPHKSLGIEHASPDTIINALRYLMTPRVTVSSDIDQSFLLQQGLLSGPNARERRAVVGEKLHIGYTNGKQLIKRLNAFGIKRTQVEEALKGQMQSGKNN